MKIEENCSNGIETKILDEIGKILLPIHIFPMDGKLVPVRNTTREECYQALFAIQNLVGTAHIRALINAAKYIDFSKIFDDDDDDIQHVGYTDEQLGREK